MYAQIFTEREQQMLKVVDTINELCVQQTDVLIAVPKFVAKIQTLRDKRSEVNAQSIRKHQAKTNKSVITSDVDAQKIALATMIDEKLGLFTEYAKDENDTTLSSVLKNLSLTKLKTQKPLDMITNIQSFVNTAKNLDAVKVAEYGIKAAWLQTLQDKVTSYEEMQPKKNATNQHKPLQTSSLKTLIKELMDIKNSLDNLVLGYKDEHSEFYYAYQNVRTVYKTLPKSGNKKPKPPKNEKPPL